MSRMAAVRRIQASAAEGDARALVAALRANMSDAMVAEHALDELHNLFDAEHDRGIAMTAERGAGGVDAVVHALRTHRANVRVSQLALLTLQLLFDSADAALMSECAACAEAVFAAARLHSADADVIGPAFLVVAQMCVNNEQAVAVVVGAAPDAVDVISSALRAHMSNSQLAITALHALSHLFLVKSEATSGVAAGCVELATTAMRTHRNSNVVHMFACRALAHSCVATTAGEVVARMIAAGAIEEVVSSLRRFPDCAGVQLDGLKALWYYTADGGDGVEEVAVQAAYVALQRHSRGELNVLRLCFAMLCYLQPRLSSRMLVTFGTPEAIALLKSSLARLERAGKSTPDYAALVRRMTHGACAGCGELQETKMKRCARCLRGLYCSADCQRSHWAVHKRECTRPAAKADGGDSAA